MKIHLQNESIYKGKYLATSIVPIENPEKFEYYCLKINGFNFVVRFDPNSQQIWKREKKEGNYYSWSLDYYESFRDTVLKSINAIKEA